MKTIIMTGGTSGFGKIALEKMKSVTDTRIILGVRSKGPKDVETLPLDLSKFDSVRFFASEVCKLVSNDEINALVFNAGISLSTISKTLDGFETTFAVNHLSHYLLLRLLLPKLSHKAKIILTTSGTYDPAEKTMIPPPIHANAKLLAYPELDPNLDQDLRIACGRAYSSSKLCTILTSRALIMNPEVKNRKLAVIAYDPGPTPGTGLVRDSNIFVRIIWYILGTPIFRLFLPNMNSRMTAGSTLADLTLGNISIPEGYFYAALRKGKITYPKLSELANRDDLMNALWYDSAVLVGL